jgi:ethanolamine transporter EutH
MENNPPSAFKSALKYGLILAAISILYSLLLYSFDLMSNRALSLVSVVILLACIYWGVKEYRDKKAGGFVTFGKAFKIGFFIGLICAVIAAVYTFIFFKYFDPELVVKMIADAEEKMIESRPNMDDSEIETAMAFTKKFMSPSMMAVVGMITNIAFSAVIALIVAAVLKKEEDKMPSAM